MPAPHYDVGDIVDAQLGKPNLTIGPYTFFCNPWEFRVQEQRIQSLVPTKAGVGRFAYGVQARQYTISGYFSNSGLDGMNGMQQIAPTFKKAHAEMAYYLTFPMFGLTRVKVYINEVDYYVERDMENYIKYTITAVELPPAQQPYQARTQPGAYGLAGPIPQAG
jgi:hypothetical protein